MPRATLRRVAPPETVSTGRVGCMAQHHKGSRVYMAARLPEDVYAAVKAMAADTGLSMSQLVADLLCEAVGRPDLVRNLGKHNEGVLPLAM